MGSVAVDENAAAAWNGEYANGRYRGEAPVGFVEDILTAWSDPRSRRDRTAGGSLIDTPI
ncbi:MAG: hypothetical protein ACRDR6_20785 [Pseudonocardiaceae bacterium]